MEQEELRSALAASQARKDQLDHLLKWPPKRKVLSVSEDNPRKTVEQAVQDTLDQLGQIDKINTNQQSKQAGKLYAWTPWGSNDFRFAKDDVALLHLIVRLGDHQPIHVPWLFVAKSTLEDAHYGLFAARTFAVGDPDRLLLGTTSTASQQGIAVSVIRRGCGGRNGLSLATWFAFYQ